MLPFTNDQFFQLFESYNRTIWPVHIVAYSLAGFVLWAILTSRSWNWRIAAFVLSLLWLWNGIAYHLAFFTSINPVAYGFAILFVAQGLLFFASALSERGPYFVVGEDWRTAIALATITYALIIYGVLGSLAGHGWPVLPCLVLRHAQRRSLRLGFSCWRGRRCPVGSPLFPSCGLSSARPPRSCLGCLRTLVCLCPPAPSWQ